ncbi:peptidase S41 [Bacillus pseudomycoides]|uniref:S41 family peptidase n=1 Tax=Bacillus pseudomycoides TaxID=64104 RepID=UPI000BEBFFBC|nr:peptidase S41 [Bacillus pseudomycoides]PEE07640.1 peptidase S41 [Bacillus pseudomycoides]PEK80624.1 peptidase S41 [Bacillus pseudomycoides]PEM74274.1 peptidase S41 [Bacillus pseudomycoides]PEN08232.1 peptidase S41 [Bacillus pseudomycoides]
MKRRVAIIGMIVAFLIGAGGMFAGMYMFGINPSYMAQTITGDSAGTKQGDLAKINEAYALIDSRYVEDVKDEKLVEGAIQGMLSTLKDPYSTYMDKETAKQFTESLDPELEGIGAEVNKTDGKLIIVSPIKGSPAEKAGIKPNDQILSVNGNSVKDLSREEAVLKIRGKQGTDVTLEIKRSGVADPLEFKIKREKIPIFTVFSSVKKEKEKNIGYIQITSFSENTAKEFKDQLKELEKKDIKGLVIDVRGNPGGYLNSVQDILGLIMTDKKPMMQVEQRNGEKKKFSTALKERKSYPISVLIDKGSASASEILAGALKEGEGYDLVGEKTFGKGTVQQAVPFKDGSNIKLTMFKWLTPDGNWIHKKGIAPTVEVKQPDYYHATPIQIEKTLSYNSNDVQVKHAQEMLKSLGYVPGREDGYFSKETESALKAFQNANEMEMTGQLDKKTAEAIQNKIIEKIRSGENDLQLQAALKIMAK